MYAKILVALDGSKYSLTGGDIAVSIAQVLGSEIIATHIYDAGIHTTRFGEMEPVLPEQYQDEKTINRLRLAHDDLINEGFDALSRGYVEEFVGAVKKKSVPVATTYREGRNYVQLINLIEDQKVNIVVLGAAGLGETDGRVGSNAQRVLRHSTCDVLISRKPWTSGGRILVGIDGSEESFSALRKASFWARALKKTILLVAAYDPEFHVRVFKTMAHSLSEERQEEVGLSKQESLHDQIIDDGLGELYLGFLHDAERRCRETGLECEINLLQAKPYKGVLNLVESEEIDLVVVGRFGHHRGELVKIGSNSEAVASLAPTNVLVTSPSEAKPLAEESEDAEMEWEQEAVDALQRVPSFARPMARAAVENEIRAKGGDRVSLEDFRNVASKFGMGKPG